MKTIIKILFFLLIPLSVSGQLTPTTSQYVLNPLLINPATAGNRGVLSLAAFYRKQWVGIKGTPETITLTADAPFNDDKLGLGLLISNDKIGVNRETRFNTNYSYRIAMGKGTLSLGLGAGLTLTHAKWSDLIVLDPGDDNYLIDSKTFAIPNFSFGAYYSNLNYFAGLSIPKLIGHKFDFIKNKYVLKNNLSEYSYMLNTGYIFDLSPKVKFFPSTLLILTPGNKLLFDINAHFRIMDRFWLGASYRNDRSVNALFQFQLTDQMKFAYTYDMDFGMLRTFSSGSHEIMLRYEFRYKVEAISPLNF
ncbi:MAG: type IX secretion system membrane protein PorP/SprF [Bacteroidales bacterium]